MELSLAWPSISRSFAATGRFAWHDEPIDVTIGLTDFVATLNGDRSGLKVRLAGTPFKFAFDGYISHRPTLKMEGTLAADAASLRDTLRWAGQQPLPGGGFGRFALKAQTNVVGGTIGLSGVNIELDGNSGEGVLTFDGRQTLQGTLAAEGLDLSPYVSAVRLLTSGERGWDGTDRPRRPRRHPRGSPAVGSPRQHRECQARTHRDRRQSARRQPHGGGRQIAGLRRRGQRRSGSPNRRPAPTSRRNCSSPMSTSSSASATCSAFAGSRAKAISASRSTARGAASTT